MKDLSNYLYGYVYIPIIRKMVSLACEGTGYEIYYDGNPTIVSIGAFTTVYVNLHKPQNSDGCIKHHIVFRAVEHDGKVVFQYTIESCSKTISAVTQPKLINPFTQKGWYEFYADVKEVLPQFNTTNKTVTELPAITLREFIEQNIAKRAAVKRQIIAANL